MLEKKKLIDAIKQYGSYMNWSNQQIIEHLMELGITKTDFVMLGEFKEQFPVYVA